MNITLGGIERVKDIRDYSLEKVNDLLGASISLPETYSIDTSKITQNWQASWPACGSHSASHLVQVMEFIESGLSVRISPAFLWKEIKLIDEHPPEDGTDMASIMRVLQHTGACEYDLLPNNYAQGLSIYTNASVITSFMIDDAQIRIIKDYAYGTDLSFDGIKRSIYTNKAVLLLIHCDDGFFNTSAPTFTERKYGHFVVALGYDQDHIIIIDSTEKDFPIKKIHKDYIKFVRELGTVVDLSNDYVRELVKKRGLLQQLIGLYQQLKRFLK